MSRELLQYYSLSKLPFSKETETADLLRLPSIEKSLSALKLLPETRGIGVLSGRSGTGKSCLLRMLCSELNAGLFKPLYICHSSVGLSEFYTHIASVFGLEVRGRRAGLFRKIKDHVESLSKKQIHPVLIIDEAHLLSNDILKELRLLMNYDMDSRNSLSILLCGQETLLQKFGLSILEPLANSITITVSTRGLPEEETFSYIESSLSRCGSHASLFTKNALTFIHQASGGILRSIGIIANGALMKAYFSKSPAVEAEHVRAVIER